MKSDVIRIDNQGYGFEDAIMEVERAACYRGLSHKEEMQLRLCAEEMLSLFEEAIIGYPDDSDDGIPDEVYKDLVVHPAENSEWDEYEKSVLRSVADKVKIAIRGDSIDMTVSKSFG